LTAVLQPWMRFQVFILLSESHFIQATKASVDLLAGLMSILRDVQAILQIMKWN
jgi:hypothetical protein